MYAESDNPDAELGARGIAVSNNYVYVLYNPNTNRMHEEQKQRDLGFRLGRKTDT